MNLKVTAKERQYLRDLAKKQAEIAKLPIMKQRTEAWYAHNAFHGTCPLVIMETKSFWQDMKPESKCESEFAKQLEDYMLQHIIQHEEIDDDCVCPDYIEIRMGIHSKEFGIPIPTHHSTDSQGRSLAYEWEHPIACIEEDFHKLKPFEFYYDQEESLAQLDAAQEILGDILPVHLINRTNDWGFVPTHKAVMLMGLENWMISIMDEPEQNHRLMRYLTDNILAFAHWQEDNGLLTMNNGNHFAGAGSRGFTHELTLPADGKVRCKDLWLNTNSQESFSLSPMQFKEFVFPYYKELAEHFGLLYYGCCEPVHTLWKDCLETIPNLRKISVSAWCDEDYMGEALRGSKTIYSRKPSPTYIGVGRELDEDSFTEHIRKTLQAARGCQLEMIFRDIYTLTGNTAKPGRAVQIVRNLIEKEWK